jgi:hypothetical protein
LRWVIQFISPTQMPTFWNEAWLLSG